MGRLRRGMARLFLATILQLAPLCVASAGEPDRIRLSLRIAQARKDEQKTSFYMSVARQRRVKEQRSLVERTAPKEVTHIISGRLPPSGR